VRRQFNDIPALKSALEIMRKYDANLENATEEDLKIFQAADGMAEYDKCVEISTKASIKEMITPGLLAVLVPVIIGFLGGAEMLGGLLAGVTSSGVLMAIFQSNAGGAWDNAKKMFEEGVEIQGQKYFKGSEPHKAAIVGDTVGDPFKDTSGPSLNILLKLMSVVALVIAPSIAIKVETPAAFIQEKIEISVKEKVTVMLDEAVPELSIFTETISQPEKYQIAASAKSEMYADELIAEPLLVSQDVSVKPRKNVADSPVLFL
jgi:K(+)-stimulated pyrophosphate-energized sodium pump